MIPFFVFLDNKTLLPIFQADLLLDGIVAALAKTLLSPPC
jgi:hypothetical protein